MPEEFEKNKFVFKFRSLSIRSFFRPITENTLPFTNPMTLRPKFREQNPAMNYRDENSPIINLVIFDRNITG